MHGRLTLRVSLKIVVLLLAASVAVSCGSSPSAPAAQPSEQTPPPGSSPAPDPVPATPATWDVAAQGVPKLATHNYIDLARIDRISKFRSGIGHDYADDFERCRSMKHYFQTPQDASAASVRIYAPFAGTVTRTIQEWAGVQIHITSKDYPAFTAILFHVNPTVSLSDGTQLAAGQRIGTHIGSQTMSDITIAVSEAAGRRFVSWFHAMSDGVFAAYRARGMTSRDQAVISKAARDAAPLTCNGETFASEGTLGNWVALN